MLSSNAAPSFFFLCHDEANASIYVGKVESNRRSSNSNVVAFQNKGLVGCLTDEGLVRRTQMPKMIDCLNDEGL